MEQLQLPLAATRAPDTLGKQVMGLLAAHSGGPSPILTVTKARKSKTGCVTSVTADVVLFDGQPAAVRVWVSQRNGIQWSGHRWLELPGGNIELCDGAWRRDVLSSRADEPAKEKP